MVGELGRRLLVIAGSAAMIAVLFSPTDSIARQQAISTSLGSRGIGPSRESRNGPPSLHHAEQDHEMHPGLLTGQALALAARPPGVLLLERRGRHHAAVLALAPEPAKKHPHEHREIEPGGLGPPVLARDCDAGRMDDMGLDTALPEPARQPEPVATGFEGQHDPPDRPSCLYPLVPPALQQFDERRRSEEHTSELQSHSDLVCRLLLEKKKNLVMYSLAR